MFLAITASLALAAPRTFGPPSILPPEQVKDARALVATLADWIMGLDLGSGTVKGYDPSLNHLNHSIFINGNLARVLLASSRLTSNSSHSAEAMRYCEALTREQVMLKTAVLTSYPSPGPQH